jgi:uncharacterized membrane protein
MQHSRLHLRRYLIAGVLMITPLWVTWLVLDFIFGLLSRVGRPWLEGMKGVMEDSANGVPSFLDYAWIESLIAAALTLLLLYVIGWATTHVLARQVIARLEAWMERIPLVQVIYGSTKKLLLALRSKPESVQRVVLIDFPAPPLKTVALVTQVIRDRSSGREMAILYVPTAPNPTSGYMEILPVELLTPTDWTLDEAMRFVITCGTSAPAEMDFARPYVAGEARAAEVEAAKAPR